MEYKFSIVSIPLQVNSKRDTPGHSFPMRAHGQRLDLLESCLFEFLIRFDDLDQRPPLLVREKTQVEKQFFRNRLLFLVICANGQIFVRLGRFLFALREAL